MFEPTAYIEDQEPNDIRDSWAWHLYYLKLGTRMHILYCPIHRESFPD